MSKWKTVKPGDIKVFLCHQTSLVKQENTLWPNVWQQWGQVPGYVSVWVISSLVVVGLKTFLVWRLAACQLSPSRSALGVAGFQLSPSQHNHTSNGSTAPNIPMNRRHSRTRQY
ncbi:hypothetical protein G6F42_025533 [Rhizopus arrhizus]|nr:hypothetical protein G6F42_025533 [Rhizopus arrhizus]